MKTPLRMVMAALVLLSAAGCMAIGGTTKNCSPTLGKQLCDLKLARDTGAIDDKEYASAKSRLLCSGK